VINQNLTIVWSRKRNRYVEFSKRNFIFLELSGRAHPPPPFPTNIHQKLYTSGSEEYQGYNRPISEHEHFSYPWIKYSGY